MLLMTVKCTQAAEMTTMKLSCRRMVPPPDQYTVRKFMSYSSNPHTYQTDQQNENSRNALVLQAENEGTNPSVCDGKISDSVVMKIRNGSSPDTSYSADRSKVRYEAEKCTSEYQLGTKQNELSSGMVSSTLKSCTSHMITNVSFDDRKFHANSLVEQQLMTRERSNDQDATGAAELLDLAEFHEEMKQLGLFEHDCLQTIIDIYLNDSFGSLSSIKDFKSTSKVTENKDANKTKCGVDVAEEVKLFSMESQIPHSHV